MFSDACRLVGSDCTSGAGFGSRDALDFGQRRDAGFGDALAVDHGAAEGKAASSLGGAGLAQLRVGAGFERSAALGAGHVDITIGDAHGHGFRSHRTGDGGESDLGEDETHEKNSGFERVSEGTMPLTGIRLLLETLVQCTRELCKCEIRENGSKDCNVKPIFFREPSEIMQE